MTSRRGLVLCSVALPLLAACKIVKKGTTGGDQSAAPGDDRVHRIAADWDAKIVPYARQKAAPWKDLKPLLASSLDQAVAAHGHASAGGAKPVVWALVEGTIVAANTESRAATISIDTTGGGSADVTVQIGPVIHGSALRDGLGFVDFTQFANQIDFADYSRALNAHVRDVVLKGLDRNMLKGKHVTLIGAFFVDAAASVPLVTPVTFQLGSAP